AVVVVFNEFTPTRLTKSTRVIVNVVLPGFAVVSHNVTLEIHVLVTLDWLPWFALTTIRDHITACRFHNLSNLRIKRGLRLPSPELGLCGLNQLVQLLISHVSQIHSCSLVEGDGDAIKRNPCWDVIIAGKIQASICGRIEDIVTPA